MKIKTLLFASALFYNAASFAQALTTPPDGGNKKASVSERIGITDVEINYDRPAVKGREGKIWGDLVPKGFTDQGFGTSKAAPWRAGANENTTISFSTDVKVDGKPLAAGKYGFFIAPGDNEATLIFSHNAGSWGSFFYKESEDALRVNVKTALLAESVERLKYEFSGQKENSAVVSLIWEKLKIPFTVEVDLVNTQLETFRTELRSKKGFDWKAYDQAANYAVDHNGNLDEALQWADYSMSGVFVGEKNFRTLSTKAKVLRALNRSADAEVLMKEAMPFANMQELHGYGRSMLTAKKYKDALEIFKLNAQKNPNTFTVYMGLTRGYSANGDFTNALKSARTALTLAPNKGSSDQASSFIKMLEDKKDVNQ